MREGNHTNCPVGSAGGTNAGSSRGTSDNNSVESSRENNRYDRYPQPERCVDLAENSGNEYFPPWAYVPPHMRNGDRNIVDNVPITHNNTEMNPEPERDPEREPEREPERDLPDGWTPEDAARLPNDWTPHRFVGFGWSREDICRLPDDCWYSEFVSIPGLVNPWDEEARQAVREERRYLLEEVGGEY